MSEREPKGFDSTMCSGSVQAGGNGFGEPPLPNRNAAFEEQRMALPEISRIPSDNPSETLPNDEHIERIRVLEVAVIELLDRLMRVEASDEHRRFLAALASRVAAA